MLPSILGHEDPPKVFSFSTTWDDVDEEVDACVKCGLRGDYKVVDGVVGFTSQNVGPSRVITPLDDHPTLDPAGANFSIYPRTIYKFMCIHLTLCHSGVDDVEYFLGQFKTSLPRA